jgi:hypothetical protein
VVEVGVDVQEATMMVIEGADRFGLAQLHQLRGRVGRGPAESFCVLVSESTDETAQARLEGRVEIRDGFELAERDFELRREGDVLGLAQSGLPRLRVASLQDRDHVALAQRARDHAERCSTPTAGSPRRRRRSSASSSAAGWQRVWAGDPRAARSGRVADAGRVIAGSAKGIRLAAPGPGTRPLSDRVKQTLFAILEPDLDGAAVLDLFAGSGAGGIEALSRGAASATFVEHDRAPRRRSTRTSARGLAGDRRRSSARTRSAGSTAARRRAVRRRPRRPALRRDGPDSRVLAILGAPGRAARRRRPRRRQALLARSTARADRYAGRSSATAASARPR